MLWGTRFVLDVPGEVDEIEEMILMKTVLQWRCFSCGDLALEMRKLAD